LHYKRPTRSHSLLDQQPVHGEGPNGDAPICLLGEAPGADEASQGQPFVGKAGKFLDMGLGKAGIYKPSTWRTNVLAYRPPNNQINSAVARDALEATREDFWDELRWLVSEKRTRVVVALGATAMHALGIEGSISKLRGSVVELSLDEHGPIDSPEAHADLVVLPTYHPSFLLRGGRFSNSGRGSADLAGLWIADLRKAKQIADEGWRRPVEDFTLFPELDDLEELARRDPCLLALDIETSHRDIVVIGFAWSTESGLSVPFKRQHGLEYWSPTELLRVRELLNEIFTKHQFILQNAMFDVPRLRDAGFTVPWSQVAHDTLLLHHCVAEDTLIDTLDWGRVPIKDLEGLQDFWVVSHDGEQLTPKPVSQVWKSANHRDDMIRIVFWSKDRKDTDQLWLDCTSDHKLPLQDGRWVKAKDLKPGDRLIRGQVSRTQIEKQQIHRWVYESTTGDKIEYPWQIHHRDGNHNNNNPNNLQKVTINEHQRYHTDIQYRATMQMQRNARQRVEKDIDADQAYHLYYNVGLSYRETAEHMEVDRERLKALFKGRGWKLRTRSEATRLRWEKQRNCRVVSVVPLKRSCAVYDMTVPETHVYSANGVIVSNSGNPELPHNLGFITSVYGVTPYWKEDFLGRTGSIYDLPDETLRRYNLRDCVVLHQVLPGLLEDLRELEGVESVYHEESLALLPVIDEMQRTGLLLDSSKLAAWKRKVIKERNKLARELTELGGLPPSFDLGKDSDVRLFLYGLEDNKFRKADELPNKRKGTKVHAELTKLHEVRTQTRPLYLLNRYQPRTTDTGIAQVDKQARLRLRAALNNRLRDIAQFKNQDKFAGEREQIENLLAWLGLYDNYKACLKLLSTYASFPTDEHNVVHTQYLLHGTATGRLASRSINQQNLPKGQPGDLGYDLRKVFVAPEDHVIMAADYANLEVKVLAYETDDDVLIDILHSGKNLHDENTKILFGLKPGDELWAAGRAAAKVFQFGGISYGGGDQEVHEKVLLAAPQLNLTLSDYKQAKQAWLAKHPKYVAWKTRTQQQAKEQRYVQNAFGRVRYLYGPVNDIMKQSINTLIQSAAASIINRAAVAIWHRLRNEGFQAKLQAQIHDELRLVVPKREVTRVAELVREEMERPVNFRGVQRSFEVDIEVGPNWGELEELT